MKVAQIPDNEQARLAALESYDILDTEAEQCFDDLTELAADICETPISLISLVDPDRQWFKSKYGIDADATSRDIAFCAHAILEREVFEISNALKDERFHDNPLVTGDPNIRFYAGTQLLNPDGYPLGTLCVISDEPKTLSKRQKNALTVLGREVITQLELRAKTKRLELDNQRKTEFLSNVSHEIRTPLGAIVGLTEQIRQLTPKTNDGDQVHSYLSYLEFSSQRLMHLVNSVLDINRIESGKMEVLPRPINLDNFIDNLMGSMIFRAKDKKVLLTRKIPPEPVGMINVDDQKLGQVLYNIIGNAIKFTQAGKSVRLEVSVDKDTMTFTVIDKGIGIARPDMARLFTKFTQVGEQKEPGSGLGLYISKCLMALMGGSLDMTSEIGKGTQVVITLPLERVESLDGNTPLKPVACPPGLAVLVVEDNPINQAVAKAQLQNLKCEPTLCGDAEQGLEKLQTETYDIILMDLNLPGIDGLTATRRIKEQGIKTPVIALTADAFMAEQDQQIFDSYLTKPVMQDQLAEALARTKK